MRFMVLNGAVHCQLRRIIRPSCCVILLGNRRTPVESPKGQCELSLHSSVFQARSLFEGISSHCCLDSALWGFVSCTHVGSASRTLLS